MKSLFHAAAELETFLVERGWQYCFIGGIALQRWGQPRLTNDVDLTILAGFGNEAIYVDALLEQMHKQGYERNPPHEGEFDLWEKEQIWPDS